MPFRVPALPPLLAGLLLLLVLPASAASLSDADTTQGLKEALTRGAGKAVEVLGQQDGFLGNDKVRILLPEKVKKAEKLVRRVGAGKYADQLLEAMNRAAEIAVQEAKPILWQAIKEMTVKDGIVILRGPDDAATQYFRRTSSAALTAKFRPVVEKATAKVGVAQHYEKLAAQATRLKLLPEKDADLDGYITGKTLDGLFFILAQEEKQIRKDPVATGSAIIKKVFGKLFK